MRHRALRMVSSTCSSWTLFDRNPSCTGVRIDEMGEALYCVASTGGPSRIASLKSCNLAPYIYRSAKPMMQQTWFEINKIHNIFKFVRLSRPSRQTLLSTIPPPQLVHHDRHVITYATTPQSSLYPNAEVGFVLEPGLPSARCSSPARPSGRPGVDRARGDCRDTALIRYTDWPCLPPAGYSLSYDTSIVSLPER